MINKKVKTVVTSVREREEGLFRKELQGMVMCITLLRGFILGAKLHEWSSYWPVMWTFAISSFYFYAMLLNDKMFFIKKSCNLESALKDRLKLPWVPSSRTDVTDCFCQAFHSCS